MSETTTAAELIKHRSVLNPFARQDAAKVAEYAKLVEAVDKEARERWDDPAWHREIAAVLAATLDYGFTFENLFSQYFQTRNVGEFDKVVLRERRGLKVFYTSRGGYINESQIRTERWELPRDTLGFHVSEHSDKLRMNFGTSLNDMAALGQQRLEAEVNRRIFSLLQAAIPNSSDYYVSTAGITKPEVDAAIRDVAEAVKPNGLGPVPITIAGRASVVDQISDFNLGFNTTANEEIRQRGFLGTYRGAQVVRIDNYTDEDGESYIPANELWVFGGTVGQFAMYGPVQVKTWSENTVDYQHYRARKDVGGLVHHPEQARRIVDTTL